MSPDIQPDPLARVHAADAELASARAHLAAGRLPAAKIILEDRLTAAPSDVEALELVAELCLIEGRPREAREAAARALLIAPRRASAYAVLSTVHLADGQPDDALTCADQALSLDPASEPAMTVRLQILLARNDAAGALSQAERLVATLPDSATAHALLGQALLACERPADALQSFHRAIERDERQVGGWVGLGAAFGLLGDHDGAIEALQRAILCDPTQMSARVLLARTFLMLQRPQEAEQQARRAIALQPGLAIIQGLLGEALRALGRHEEALDAFAEHMRLSPEDAAPLIGAAITRRWMEDPRRAAEFTARARRLSPDHPALPVLDAELLRLTGQMADAMRAAEAIGLFPDDRTENLPQPWTAAALAGRTVRVLPTDDPCDTLLLAPVLSALAALGARVELVSPSPWDSLVRFLPGVATTRFDHDAASEDTPGLVVTITRLPVLLSMDGVLAAPAPPRAPADRVDKWAGAFPPRAAPRRLGLAWLSRTGHPHLDGLRCGLADLAPLRDVADIEWVSLSSGAARHDLAGQAGVLDAGAHLADPLDLACAADLMDAVVTSDETVGLVAALMGRPTHLILPRPAHDRWQLDRADTPWLPTLRLYRAGPAELPAAIGRIISALATDMAVSLAGSTSI